MEGTEISGRAGCLTGVFGCGQPVEIERDESARQLRGRPNILGGRRRRLAAAEEGAFGDHWRRRDSL